MLNRLHQALHHDLDLADIEQLTLTAVLQVVFVTIGCDYVSFFARLGKVTFLHTLYQHASFITGTSMQDHGTLTDPDPNKSLLAFYFGAAYLKKHRSAFEHSSPQQLFKAITCTSPTGSSTVASRARLRAEVTDFQQDATERRVRGGDLLPRHLAWSNWTAS